MTATPLGLDDLAQSPLTVAFTWAALNGHTDGTLALSDLFDNTATTIGGAAPEEGILRLNFGVTFTPTAASPFITVGSVFLADGVTGSPAVVSGTTLYAQATRTWRWPASVAIPGNIVDIPGIKLLGCKMQLALMPQLGLAFPASGVTATLYRQRGRIG